MKSDYSTEAKLEKILSIVKSQHTTEQEDIAMQNRLNEAIEAYAGPVAEDPEQSEATIGFWQWLKQVSVPKQLGFAGSAAALVLTVAVLVTSTASAPAFAAVVKKLNAITSMVYSGEMTANGQAMMNIEVYYQAPGKLRVVNSPRPNANGAPTIINVVDTEQGKGSILFPDRNMAMPIDFAPASDAKAALEDELFDWYSTILNYQGDVNIEPSVLLYGVETTVYVIEPENMRVTLWVDPDTELPIKIRVETQVDQSFIFEADVAFNQTLEASLFDLSPQGYTLMGPDEN
ncbi:LolA family protein [Alteromonas flava]|uniref:LolA family protein n=1 Tax=Alteromonas flava TaxID=2048003 RepID=UPI000C28BB20|nr:hypothetical protein [Alteromonas flava]